MADLCPLALAMVAVSEGNRRLRAEVAARDRALDACAEQIAAEQAENVRLTGSRDALLALVHSISQSTPLPSELEGWEGQRAALVAEVGSLRAAVAEVQRERDTAREAAYEYGKRTGDLMTELRTAERQVLALTERLAEVTDELTTVQADRAAADRSASTYRRDLLALQDRVVELEVRLAVAHDDARVDREALAMYRARDATKGDIQ